MAHDSLNLHIGDPLVLMDLAGDGNTRYSVRVIGYVEDKSLLVSTPRVRGAPVLIREGQVFGVRLRESNRVVGFTTHVIRSNQSPFPYLHLHPPQEMESIVVRGEPRVPIELLVAVAERVGEEDYAESRPAMLSDLSTTGCRLLAAGALAETGARVRIAARLPVVEVHRDVALHGEIRSVSRVRSEDDAETVETFQHGVAFDACDDDARILLEAVLYEHMSKPLEGPG